MKHAVIETGGKQYRVKSGDVLKIEKLVVDKGADLEFDKVLFIRDGDNIQVGKPYLSHCRVKATVMEHGRGEKLRIIKFRRRKGYMRTLGHRQDYTQVQINDILA